MAVRGALQGAELLRYVEGVVPQGMSLLLNAVDAARGERLLRELQRVPLRAAGSSQGPMGGTLAGMSSPPQGSSPQAEEVLRQMANVYGQQLAEMTEVQSFFDEVVGKLEIMPHRPSASQLNVYPANGGIPFHVDARGIGAVIGMVSFQSPCVMELVPAPGGLMHSGAAKPSVTKVLLEPLSLLALAGPSRYEWAHRVAPGNPHVFQGREIARSTRTSFVFWSTQVDPNAPPMVRSSDFRERISSVSNSGAGAGAGAARKKLFVVPS